jgi:glutamate--cysteine ligase catalytic subunit
LVAQFFFQGDNFPGLLAFVDAYLETLEIEPRDMEKIQQYLDLVRRRSDGKHIPVELKR